MSGPWEEDATPWISLKEQVNARSSEAGKHPLQFTFWQAVPAVPIELGLAVAAEAGGVVRAEGMLGALAVIPLAGFLAGGIVREPYTQSTG